jgi:ABC-type branched-subunit amino acid transport system substrate-binding protein
VCLILSDSGPATDISAELRRGMTMAREEIDRQPGRIRRIQWVEKDDRSTEPGAIAAFQECFSEGVPLIIGPVHPAATTALIPVAAAHDTMLLIPEVTAATPTSWGKNLFAIAPAAADMGRVAAANAAKDRGLLKAAVLHVPSVFGESLTDAFTETYAQSGGNVVMKQELAMDRPEDWGKAAQEAVDAKGAQALFVIGPADAAAAVAGTLTSKTMGGVHAWFIDWAMQPPVLRAAGDAVSRVHWANRVVPRGPFAEAYKKRYQARPLYPAGSGYDAIRLAARVIDAAPSIWFEELAKVTREVRGFESAFGVGGMVEDRGSAWLDVAGYRVIEPIQDPGNQSWVFGG